MSKITFILERSHNKALNYSMFGGEKSSKFPLLSAFYRSRLALRLLLESDTVLVSNTIQHPECTPSKEVTLEIN